jgi:hypothetical protein
VYAHERIPKAERFWIEEGSHLGFWLSPHAAQAQGAAREFLDRHRPEPRAALVRSAGRAGSLAREQSHPTVPQ